MLGSVSDQLEALVALLREGSLSLEAHSFQERERVRIIEGVDEYLRPRLSSIDAPVVVAVVGPTGTGKSTIVNSLAQDMISTTGVLRPTTTAPVLWAHRERADGHLTEFVSRVRERVGPGVDLVVGSDDVTSDVTLIDTPPIDFAGEDGSFAVRDVLEVSDICIFVTSPARYADAIGWGFVAEARARGVPTLFVLNRLPRSGEEADALLADLARRLHEHELLLEPDPMMIFPVFEDVLGWHQGLDADSVAHLRDELGELADADFRNALMTQTALTTAVALAERAAGIVDAFDVEAAAVADLRLAVADTYAEQAALLETDLRTGVFAAIADRIVWPQAAADLSAVVTRRAGVAAQAVAGTWATRPFGAVVLEHGGQGLWRHGEDAARDTASALGGFTDEVATLVAGSARRKQLRPRATRAATDHVWRMALDPSREPSRVMRRRFGENLDDLVGAVRTMLATILTDRVRADGKRFTGHLGEPIPSDLAERIADTAEHLLTVARSAVPGVADLDEGHVDA